MIMFWHEALNWCSSWRRLASDDRSDANPSPILTKLGP